MPVCDVLRAHKQAVLQRIDHIRKLRLNAEAHIFACLIDKHRILPGRQFPVRSGAVIGIGCSRIGIKKDEMLLLSVIRLIPSFFFFTSIFFFFSLRLCLRLLRFLRIEAGQGNRFFDLLRRLFGFLRRSTGSCFTLRHFPRKRR